MLKSTLKPIPESVEKPFVAIFWGLSGYLPYIDLTIPGRATIPLGSNLGQVVYTHCLPSFSAPRNWGTKGSFRRLCDYGD